MTQPKKIIARLVLQGISVLGILLGFSCFLSSIAMIFSFDRVNLYSRIIFSGTGIVLGAFLMYPSYLMLRGKSFTVIKSITALLALSAFCLIDPFTEFISTSINREMPIVTNTIVDCASFLLFVLVSVLVYKISIKLLDRLIEAAYGPEILSDTQQSTNKQKSFLFS
jgi:uncharacterized membrane protein (UPF0136 family)